MSFRTWVLIRPIREEYEDLKRRIEGERRRRRVREICMVGELPKP